MTKIFEFYTVENTGWSGGISWFSSGHGIRFDTKEKAIEYIKNNKWDDPSVLWRYVHNTFETWEDWEIRGKRWYKYETNS